MYVVVGSSTTSGIQLEGDLVRERHVWSIGEASVAQSIMRNLPNADEKSISRYMRSSAERTREEREFTAAATPAARKWARAVEQTLVSLLQPHDRVTLISGALLPPPFAHVLKPQVRRHAFPRLDKDVMIEAVSITNLTSGADDRSSAQAFFSLLATQQHQDPFCI